jgi:hypothetical protein
VSNNHIGPFHTSFFVFGIHKLNLNLNLNLSAVPDQNAAEPGSVRPCLPSDSTAVGPQWL